MQTFGLLHDGASVQLDSGSTVCELAATLGVLPDLAVVTNDLRTGLPGG